MKYSSHINNMIIYSHSNINLLNLMSRISELSSVHLILGEDGGSTDELENVSEK